MSYTGPRGDEHYRLYEIPSHPFIPSSKLLCHTLGEEGGTRGDCGGMEGGGEPETRDIMKDRKTHGAKNKSTAASLFFFLKQLVPG